MDPVGDEEWLEEGGGEGGRERGREGEGEGGRKGREGRERKRENKVVRVRKKNAINSLHLVYCPTKVLL